jgi:hypothetical protein
MVNSIKAIGAAFAATLTVDMFKDMIIGAAAAGRQIDQLSRLSATSAANFQAQAYAAQQFGISNEKLADIFKDVQDKVGDFMQNGAGPLADFFKNIAPQVGVTADQFRNLGGPDALQLYVSSLEKANLSQNEMTFYLEAIASDSALLLPLLQNNGKAMKEMGDEAQRLGLILSNETIKANKEFASQLDRLTSSMDMLKINIGSALIPQITKLIDEFNIGIKVAGSFTKALALFGTSKPFDNPALGAKHYREELDRLTAQREELMQREGVMANTSGFDREIEDARKLLDFHEQIMQSRWNLSGQRSGMSEDPRVFGTPRAEETAGFRPPAATAAATVATGGTQPNELDEYFEKRQRDQDYWAGRLKQIEEGLMNESELLATKHAEDLARLDAAVMSEDERRLIRESLEIEHLDRMGDIEEQAKALRLQSEQDAATKKLEIEKALADERVRINQQAEQLITNAREAATSAAIGLLSALGGKSKSAAVAAIALGKALSIAQIIQNTAVAQMRALAELGPLAGSAAAAKIGVMGKVQAGLVAATGLVQAAGVMSGGSQSLVAGNTIQQSANSASQMQGNGMASPSMNQTITVQGIGADSLFSGDAVRTLIDRLIDAQRNGARIVLA